MWDYKESKYLPLNKKFEGTSLNLRRTAIKNLSSIIFLLVYIYIQRIHPDAINNQLKKIIINKIMDVLQNLQNLKNQVNTT